MISRALLLCLAGCGALTAQIDEPRLCQTLPAMALPAADGGPVSTDAALTFDLQGPLEQPGGARWRCSWSRWSSRPRPAAETWACWMPPG